MNPSHFIIHTDQGDIVVKKNKKGMPFLNLAGVDAEIVLSFVQTVRGTMEQFTKQEVEDAWAACEEQAMVGHPTDCNFLDMVCAHMIPNCPMTNRAVKNANLIFGPDLAGVRGRTVRRPPEPVRMDNVQFLQSILDWHQPVTLAIDVMFVNGVPILVSVSRGFNFITVEFTPTCTAKAFASKMEQIAHL
jgi:hypothetical protein